MNACYQAGGHTDRKEFPWLKNVLKVKEKDKMTLVHVPADMAEVDKLLVAALRKRDWMPAELAREVQKVEAGLLRQEPDQTSVPAGAAGL